MRQHDDAVVGFALLEIGRQPGELCVAQPGARIGNIVEHDEMYALVVERVMRRAEEFPVGLAGVERGIVLARHEAPSFTRNAETISRKRCIRARRSFGSSVVWVRSPVKTMKSGGLARPFTVATARPAGRAPRARPARDRKRGSAAGTQPASRGAEPVACRCRREHCADGHATRRICLGRMAPGRLRHACRIGHLAKGDVLVRDGGGSRRRCRSPIRRGAPVP